ncbi:putative copper resistance protein D [Pseudonocardia sediminis]|uniref:Putative copper resistance protein D n=1 Tax=Pseudonocardia sediminis TaxID=1397368 RepID=A0A4Q7UU23_PSEST|nr:cytochrome c oxidase assembly protein [Pseudonocardia sediminis]RZT83513.1 putative copper resistance protein D [Pseudonocardia sediminis]
MSGATETVTDAAAPAGRGDAPASRTGGLRPGAVATGLTVLGVVVCALAAAAIVLTDAGVYARVGVPAPPLDVRILGPVLRTVALLSGALAAGALLFAAFQARPQASGTVGVEGYRALRRAGVAAAVAGFAALGAAWTTTSDLTGSALLAPAQGGLTGWFTVFATLEEPMGWLFTGIALLLVAAGCTWFLSWRAVGAMGLLAAVCWVFPAAVSPAATGANHDWSGDGGMIRAVGGIVWLGAVAALAAYRTHGGEVTDVGWRRFRLLVLGSGTLFVVGELIFQVVVVGGGSLTGTAYGRLLLAEIALVLVVGVATVLLLRRGPAAAGSRTLVPLVLGGALVAVLGVAMGHMVPPRFLVSTDSDLQTLIGWDVDRPFGAIPLLVDWRFNIIFGTGILLAAGVYLLGVRTVRARGIPWSTGRTVAWLLGCTVVLLATSSGLGFYSPAMFSAHMISHMSLNMLAPVLLCLGGPVTLALRVLPTAGKGNPPGPREWILAFVHSGFAKVLTNPAVAAILFVGSFYVLYFTGLFDGALRFHWSHQLMNLHFILVGYLFFWPLIGVDTAPNKLPHLGRLAVLLATMPFHAFFGIAVMSSDTVLGENFYRSVGLPWVSSLIEDQHVGGGIAWATGEIPMLLVVIVLIVQWSRDDTRTAVRKDRQADRDGDADLTAYNEMLAKLRSRG